MSIECAYRWNYVVIDLQHGKTNTCCKTQMHTADIKIPDAFLNSPYQLERRKELKDGIRYTGCDGCWKVEDAGGRSWRMNAPIIQQEIDARNGYESNYIDLLELTLGNTCDMKCIYCSKEASSQWAIEDLKHKRITKEQYKENMKDASEEFLNYFWNWFDAKKDIIKHIQIKGGEPLIMPNFYKLLEKIKDTDIKLFVITNLNTPDKQFDKFLDYLEKIPSNKEFTVYISMDTVSKYAEYIRNGLSWKQFEKNIDKIYNITKNMDHVKIGFITTMTVLNLKTHHKLLEFIFKYSNIYKKETQLNFNHVDKPSELNPYNAPPHFANFIDSSLDILYNVSKNNNMYQTYISYLINLKTVIKNNQIDNNKAYNRVKDIDRERNLNYIDLFPELKNDH